MKLGKPLSQVIKMRAAMPMEGLLKKLTPRLIIDQHPDLQPTFWVVCEIEDALGHRHILGTVTVVLAKYLRIRV